MRLTVSLRLTGEEFFCHVADSESEADWGEVLLPCG